MVHGAERILVVVEKVVVVVVGIRILVVRWKHRRFGGIDEDELRMKSQAR